MNSIENQDIGRPDEDPINWIAIGYFFAVLGGIVGIFIGWHILMSKPTEPEDTQRFAYSKRERSHGLWILFIGAASMLFWVYINFFYFRIR
ncbi:MAG: hypothetical protein NXI20_01245 [bacterium]|nr:hypothetical protein [bacterium]